MQPRASGGSQGVWGAGGEAPQLSDRTSFRPRIPRKSQVYLVNIYSYCLWLNIVTLQDDQASPFGRCSQKTEARQLGSILVGGAKTIELGELCGHCGVTLGQLLDCQVVGLAVGKTKVVF